MELEHGIEVREVGFDKFERRKTPREKKLFKLDKRLGESDLGIEVIEVSFDKFERRNIRR
jgi:hypothetical protein